MSSVIEVSRSGVISSGENLSSSNIAQGKYASIVVGAAVVGLITALVIGILFGPIAALIGFCLSGLGSAIHAIIVAKRFENKVSADSQQQSIDTPVIGKQADYIPDDIEANILKNQKRARAILDSLK